MKVLYPTLNGSIFLAPDSAWRPAERMPYFIPDVGAKASVHYAFRVGRLGKSIGPEFAPRYIDACCETIFHQINGLTPEASLLADDALCHGEWLPISSNTPKGPFDSALEWLVRISALTTFKTGDVIVLPSPIDSYQCLPDHNYNRPWLELRYK